MKSSLQLLYDEHDLITEAIRLAQESETLIETNPDNFEKLVRDLILFFRNYADKYHHYKEEEILFPAMVKKQEMLEQGVIAEMLENHNDFRTMIKNIEVFLDNKNYLKSFQQLGFYAEALLDHIAVENEELFQMADTLFTAEELEKIRARFSDCDRGLGEKEKKELEAALAIIRKQI